MECKTDSIRFSMTFSACKLFHAINHTYRIRQFLTFSHSYCCEYNRFETNQVPDYIIKKTQVNLAFLLREIHVSLFVVYQSNSGNINTPVDYALLLYFLLFLVHSISAPIIVWGYIRQPSPLPIIV